MISDWVGSDAPQRLDLAAQALLQCRRLDEARSTLGAALRLLDGERRSLLADVYRARLLRTLALVASDQALVASAAISSPEIRLACRLWCHAQGKVVGSEGRDAELERTTSLAETLAPACDASMVSWTWKVITSSQRYPEFPAERWDEITTLQ